MATEVRFSDMFQATLTFWKPFSFYLFFMYAQVYRSCEEQQVEVMVPSGFLIPLPHWGEDRNCFVARYFIFWFFKTWKLVRKIDYVKQFIDEKN